MARNETNYEILLLECEILRDAHATSEKAHELVLRRIRFDLAVGMPVHFLH